MKHWTTLAAAGFLAAAAIVPAQAADISGAGATFPYPIYAKWADAYKKGNRQRPELSVDRFRRRHQADHRPHRDLRRLRHAAAAGRARQDRLSSSSRPSWAASCRSSISTASSAGELTIDGPTLAKIYLGEIKKWNDPALKKLNPNAKLPDQAIALVHRSDGSGTTFIFTNYLSKVSARLEVEGRQQHLGRMAGRHRRQGQRRRRQQRRQHQGLDRLRRDRLCQAEPPDHDEDDQQGRQDRCRRSRSDHGGRGRRRLGAMLPAST